MMQGVDDRISKCRMYLRLWLTPFGTSGISSYTLSSAPCAIESTDASCSSNSSVASSIFSSLIARDGCCLHTQLSLHRKHSMTDLDQQPSRTCWGCSRLEEMHVPWSEPLVNFLTRISNQRNGAGICEVDTSRPVVTYVIQLSQVYLKVRFASLTRVSKPC